ncbi:LysM peptidoglycan-binding domain-containing protein [Paracoccus sp. TK19116]|uniref:LysM peptidoglycan-binding domain-containing protein n=1 Tax=Paracoccus albicereus TaxID=2922394 RepID=A0ABT1MQV0_9RHOB|nr:LysM peptidoglycan-binding domain-containing protein [Paracoccus albicereus]MCQ0970694.1 LysM peptidoglycan-binding domain-containing protein [Paracoccus albicereus]
MRLRILGASALMMGLASCGANGTFDPDLRGLMGGPTTADAAGRAAPRPAPDARGVITFPNAQVAVARQGDSVATIAARLGIGAAELASHNAIDANAVLQEGAIVALPRRIPAGAPGPSGQVSTTGQVTDPFAGQSAASAPAAGTSSATPREHVVQPGETAWSIARRYSVGINDLAAWNGLPDNMAIRTGQRLLVPVPGQQPPSETQAVSAPGTGTRTPQPPSAARPLPEETTQPASTPVERPDGPDLGDTRTAASGSGQLRMPVNGAIIRPYEKGRNEGIDISAPQGTSVSAAGAGRVAAITRDTDGVPIVVIRHDGDLMTVYAGLNDLTVAKGDSVTSGQKLGTATAAGVVHFEVRRGFDSTDPEAFF